MCNAILSIGEFITDVDTLCAHPCQQQLKRKSMHGAYTSVEYLSVATEHGRPDPMAPRLLRIFWSCGYDLVLWPSSGIVHGTSCAVDA